MKLAALTLMNSDHRVLINPEHVMVLAPAKMTAGKKGVVFQESVCTALYLSGKPDQPMYVQEGAEFCAGMIGGLKSFVDLGNGSKVFVNPNQIQYVCMGGVGKSLGTVLHFHGGLQSAVCGGLQDIQLALSSSVLVLPTKSEFN